MAEYTKKGKKQAEDFKKRIQYEDDIVRLIRERYSPNEENAILRKKLAGIDTKHEFEEFNAYVEECKKRVNK